MNTTLRALINQAERLVSAGVCEEAIALCHAILRRYPRYARCYRILGEAYLGLAEYEEAAKLFRRALGVHPEDPIPYAGLSIIFEERGLLEEAIWQMERAFELAPGRDELRHELARLYERRGSPAQVQLTRAALARLYARGGLWNKAIGELRDLLVREPYRLDLRATLARTLWRARRREEAAEVAQAILDQAPNCLVALLILGTYRGHEGRDDEGQPLLETAQELDPENREAVRLLARESPLPLRVAPVETAGDIAAGLAEEAGEQVDEEAGPWPAPAEEPSEAGEAAGPVDGEEEPRLGEEHIVQVPVESIQELLEGADGANRLEPEPDEPLAEDLGAQEAEGELPPMEAAEPVPGGESPDEPAPGGEWWGEAPEESAPGGEWRDEAPDEQAPVDEWRYQVTDEPREVDAILAPEPVADDEAPPILSPVAILRRRVEASPDDCEVRLALARALADDEDLEEALRLYDGLATPTTGYLEAALADLEALALAHTKHRGLRELMGDAYARAGRFQEAMHMYRWLLTRDDQDSAAGG